MHLIAYLTSTLAVLSAVNARSIPEEAAALAIRSVGAVSEVYNEYLPSALEKRKGGGGKGGGGGGGSKSGGSTSSGRTSSTSNVGGQTKSGSGSARQYGGGAYYGGGASVPYAAGSRSPGGISPLLLGGAAALVLFPGIWALGAWSYPYSHPYVFWNHSNVNSTNPQGTNSTLNITCLCANYQTCGCDDNTNSTYIEALLGNGSYTQLNATLVQVSTVNGTQTIAINGTLANGTTASGGTSDAAGMIRAPYQTGLWAFAAIVGYAVMTL